MNRERIWRDMHLKLYDQIWQDQFWIITQNVRVYCFLNCRLLCKYDVGGEGNVVIEHHANEAQQSRLVNKHGRLMRMTSTKPQLCQSEE